MEDFEGDWGGSVCPGEEKEQRRNEWIKQSWMLLVTVGLFGSNWEISFGVGEEKWRICRMREAGIDD